MKDTSHGERLVNAFVYDGCCAICFKTTLFIKRFNPQIAIFKSQEIPEGNFFAINSKDFQMYAFYVDENTFIHKGYSAILESLLLKKSGYHFAYIFLKSKFISFIGNVVYNIFSRNRYRLECGENCKIHNIDR